MASPTPHDRFAQNVFTDPKHAAVVFRGVLPPALVEQLDFERAELQASLFTDEELKIRRSDFLFKVPLGKSEVYLLALLEHQSTVDRLMAARMLVYVGRAVDRILEWYPTAERIPAVLPVVLHHGAGGWTAATNLADLYDLPEETRPSLEGLLPALSYRVDDLHPGSDEELRAREGPVLARLALILLRHAHELRTAKDPAVALATLTQEVGDLLQQVVDRTGRTVAFRYILEIVELAPEVGGEILVKALPKPVKEDVVTAADQLRTEGRKEGRLEGERRMFLRMLRRLFPDLTAEVEKKITGATLDDLERWADRATDASSAEEVVADE